MTWSKGRRAQLFVSATMIAVGLGGLVRYAQSAEGAAGHETPTGGPVDVATEVAGAVEVAPGAMVPTAVDHLAVVRVSVTRCGQRAHGSGVLIADDLVVTAAHVVGDAALVRLDQGARTVTGEVRGILADGRDLALIEVGGELDEPLAAAPVPRLGSPVTLVGHPGDEPLTVLVGPRVDLSESIAATARGPAFGVSVATELGMSGAPALDEAGRLVGVVVGAETASGTAIVTAIDDAAELADEIVMPGRCPVVA